MGFGSTRRDVMNIAETYATQNGVLRKESGVTQGWWRRFRDRQGDLSLRRGDNTAHVCMNSVNKETISDYFYVASGCVAEEWLDKLPRSNI